MNKNQAKDLFQLQTDLIDMKVDMAATKAMDQVIDKIDKLAAEMHEFRHDVNQRLTAVETKLGMVGEKQKRFYERTMDYLFKAGWGVLTFAFAYLIVQFHIFIK